MTDFFISYTGTDKAWAEWIAYVLEEEGYEIVIQAWDFRPGSNFVVAMQNAATSADRTIMVLSPAYLKSELAEPEWVAAFAKDLKGLEQKLVPVMVDAVEAPGMLSSVVQIRIADMPEDAARAALLAGIDRKRAKPPARPVFPGAAAHVQPKAFPGPSDPAGQAKDRSRVIPTLRASPTDIDKRRFLRSGFDAVRHFFEENAAETAEREPRIHIETEMRTNADLRAELFVDGASKGACRVWIGGMLSENSISYAEGRHFSENSCNDIISIVEHDDLFFSSTMSSGFSAYGKDHDTAKMTPRDLAEYLWQRFVSPLMR